MPVQEHIHLPSSSHFWADSGFRVPDPRADEWSVLTRAFLCKEPRDASSESAPVSCVVMSPQMTSPAGVVHAHALLCLAFCSHTHAHVCQKDSRKKNRPLQRNNVLVFPVYSSPHIVFVSLFLLLSCPPSSVTHSLGQCVRQPGLLPGAVGEVRTHRSALAVWNGKNKHNNHNLTPPLLSLLC